MPNIRITLPANPKIDHNYKIEAIKTLRELTGVELKTAKEMTDPIGKDKVFDIVTPMGFNHRQLSAMYQVLRSYGFSVEDRGSDLLNRLHKTVEIALEIRDYQLATDILEVLRRNSQVDL